jgi:signal transduction histidine kinase
MKNTVLLVDDEEDIREVIGISLTDLGYKVLIAENGQEALRIFQRDFPSIVLTDIKMPEMDGIELLRKLKQLNPDVEVIMITGHGAMDLAIMSLKYAATDFITKPINVEVLEVALEKVQDKITMKRQLREYTENLEKLIVEKTQLQDHLSSLGLMIGSISHSIKGLMTGLDGGLYILNKGFEKKNRDQIKEGLEVAKLMAERIKKMVLDILYYAKDRDLQWERVEAMSFAEEVALVVESKIKKRGVKFVRHFEPNLGKIEIDPGAVNSALINILENAVDACLNDKVKKSHQIIFSVERDEDHIIFNVKDNGIGMDPTTKNKIFTLFFSSKGDKGTGLGLFISNKIVQQHGGEIKVQSTPGRGTLFSIKIPNIKSQSNKNV